MLLRSQLPRKAPREGNGGGCFLESLSCGGIASSDLGVFLDPRLSRGKPSFELLPSEVSGNPAFKKGHDRPAHTLSTRTFFLAEPCAGNGNESPFPFYAAARAGTSFFRYSLSEIKQRIWHSLIFTLWARLHQNSQNRTPIIALSPFCGDHGQKSFESIYRKYFAEVLKLTIKLLCGAITK